MNRDFKVRSKVWLYPGMAGWHFLTLPKKEGADIKLKFGKQAKGWGSLPVSVTLGTTTWSTSIFPDSKMGSYLLPLKASVRKKEDIVAGDMVTFTLTLR
jgi:hypothetical protein